MEFTYTDSLKNEVPKEIRLEVYKKAKELIENWDNQYDLDTPQLCLLLPSILYNQDSFLQGTWYFGQTKMGFPELKKEDILAIAETEEPNIVRLKLLNKWIKQLS